MVYSNGYYYPDWVFDRFHGEPTAGDWLEDNVRVLCRGTKGAYYINEYNELSQWNFYNLFHELYSEYDVKMAEEPFEVDGERIPAGTMYFVLGEEQIPVTSDYIDWIGEEVLDLQRFKTAEEGVRYLVDIGRSIDSIVIW